MIPWWLATALAQDPVPADEAPADEAEPTEEEAADDAPGDESDPSEGEEVDDAPGDETEEEVVEAPSLVIPAYNLGSGLSTLETAGAEQASTDEAKLAEDALARLDGIDWTAPTSMLRGRWYAKPVITLDNLSVEDASAFAVRAGGAVGRMWFTTGALPVQGGADVGLHASAPIGRAVGYRLHAHGLVGPWLGPVGLRIGPTVRADRTRWTVDGTDRILDDAVLVGGRAVLAFDIGSLAPYASIEPGWAVAGSRAVAADAAASPVLPALGTETRYGAGFTVHAALFLLGVHVHRTETAVGGVNQVGASIGIRPPNNTQRGDE